MKPFTVMNGTVFTHLWSKEGRINKINEQDRCFNPLLQ